MARHRSARDQERIRQEVRAAIEEPRDKPRFDPSPIGFAAARSSCCAAEVAIGGRDESTHHHICTACGELCDAAGRPDLSET